MASLQKSLIVGASGQVGRELVLTLGENNVIPASHTPKPGCAHISLEDLSKHPEAAQRILREENIGAVYCVGGATDVERCETDRNWAVQTNHIGPSVLASIASSIPFIYFSTEYVFDGIGGPYTEAASLSPINVYGHSKALGEKAILKAHPAPLIVRTTVVYGRDPGAKNFLYSLRRNLTAGNQMRVPLDQVSTPTYNRDLAKASTLLVRGGHTGIFHVSGPDILSRYDFAVRSAVMMGLDARLVVGVPTADLGQRAQRPLNAGLLTERLRVALPEFQLRDMEDGVKDWLASLEANMEKCGG